jgi:hypothetical protein
MQDDSEHKDFFYSLHMLSKYFFNNISEVKNENYSHINMIISHDLSLDSEVKSSPLNKPLGLVNYSFNLNQLEGASDKIFYNKIVEVFADIVQIVFKLIRAECKNDEVEKVLLKIKESLRDNPENIVIPIDKLM